MKKIIEVGDYVLFKSNNIIINCSDEVLCVVSYVDIFDIIFKSVEDDRQFVRSVPTTSSDIIRVYTPKEFIEKYPEIMI
jgi:hypothetical protein